MAAKKKKTSAKAGRASAKKTPVARKSKAKKKAASRASNPTVEATGPVEDLVGQVQRLIDIMNASGAVEVEVEGHGTKLRVRRQEPNGGVQVVPAYAQALPHPIAAPVGDPGVAAHAASGAPAPVGGDVFKSPMVGTFYRSPSPDSDPFVQVGDRVGPDTTLCILEAMKVMNEIKAETSAEVVEILVQNGEPVEYGQPLFVLKPI
jgi:acetyl-CoA carboxylase biotin carboxyl carrier protein